MSLVIQSQESLDSIEKLAREYFKDIPTELNDNEKLIKIDEVINEKELIKNLIEIKDPFKIKDFPYSKETMNNLYLMESIEDCHSLKLIYCFPPVAKLFKFSPIHYLSSILGYEGENSLISYLIKNKLVLEFLTSSDETDNFNSNKYCNMFSLDIKLTDLGLEKVDLVIQLINYYIDLMVKEGKFSLIYFIQ
jgi:secreted Zn-dependent insulinase-like peptidase